MADIPAVFPETKSELERIAEQQKFHVSFKPAALPRIGAPGAFQPTGVYTVNDVEVGPYVVWATRIMYLLGAQRMRQTPPTFDKGTLDPADIRELKNRYETFLWHDEHPQYVKRGCGVTQHAPVFAAVDHE